MPRLFWAVIPADGDPMLFRAPSKTKDDDNDAIQHNKMAFSPVSVYIHGY